MVADGFREDARQPHTSTPAPSAASQRVGWGPGDRGQLQRRRDEPGGEALQHEHLARIWPTVAFTQQVGVSRILALPG